MEVDDASDQTSDGMYDHLQMLLFVCLVMFCAFFLLSADFFPNHFLKKCFRNIIRESNSLNPGQDRHSFGPDLGPNCL